MKTENVVKKVAKIIASKIELYNYIDYKGEVIGDVYYIVQDIVYLIKIELYNELTKGGDECMK